MKAYYINLDRRQDRRRQFEATCQIAGIAVERFAAIDGKEIEVPPTRGEGGRGIYASLLSHKAVIEQARDMGLPEVLIFEDDALFPEWFSHEVEYFMSLVPDDWGLIYFGGHGWPRRWEHVAGPVLRSTNVQNIDCYAVRHWVYDRVIDELERAGSMEHRWADEVLRDLQDQIPTYTLLNPLVTQSLGFSDNYRQQANDHHSRCDIPGWFTDREGQEYQRQVRRFESPAVVELGTYKGRAASFVAELIHRRGGLFICIDTWDCQPTVWGDFQWWMNATGLHRYVNTMRGDSAQTGRLFAADTFDLVMIDADHRYEAVKRDIEVWRPKVRPGGVMMGHDYTHLHAIHPGVKRAVDQMFDTPPTVVESLWIHQL